MRRALGLVCLSLVALPAAAQMPEPWAAHALPADFRSIAGLACGDEAAFAISGHGPVARFDATAWAPLPPVPGPPSSRGLWADRAGRVLLTMVDYGFARWADGAWTTAEAPLWRASTQIVSFDGEHAFAVGPGRVVAWDGGAYAAFDGGTWQDLRAIWGRAANDFWVGGTEGFIAHFDGRRFRRHAIPTDATIVHLWGTAANDVWAVAHHPTGIFHWDGARFRDRTGALAGARSAIVGGAPGHVFAVGSFGVVRWERGEWQDVLRVRDDESVLPRFTGVCATRTHVIVAERALQFPPRPRIWVRPLRD